jgi:uncharacterized protein (TIGR02996 family)
MTDEEAFLAAIREAPSDPLPRLVYADWLDEQGDPRGEFLRVHCELSEIRTDSRFHALWRRKQVLWEQISAGTPSSRDWLGMVDLRADFEFHEVRWDDQRRGTIALVGRICRGRILCYERHSSLTSAAEILRVNDRASLHIVTEIEPPGASITLSEADGGSTVGLIIRPSGVRYDRPPIRPREIAVPGTCQLLIWPLPRAIPSEPPLLRHRWWPR